MTKRLKLYDAPTSAEVDRAAAARLNLSGLELMMRAARAALDVILDRYPEVRSLSIWSGKGNNAGDGWLLGAQAVKLGLTVQLVGLEQRADLNPDAGLALDEALAAGLELTPFAPGLEIHADVIVDSLLGTGFHGALRGQYSSAIAHLNQAAQPVVAIDIPSGVNASTGGVAEIAVQAAMTVTFITHKIGLLTGAGPSHAGEVVFCHLGVDLDAPRSFPEATATAFAFERLRLSAPARQSYKHMRGHVAVVGGDHGMAGAVVLASEAALRCGAGLVTAFTRASHCPTIVGRRPEVMAIDVDGSGTAKLEQADIVVLGPGLGRDAWGLHLFLQVEASLKPTVLDADGLFHLAVRGKWSGGRLYVTPHVGEAAQLLGLTHAEIEQDRFASAQRLRDQFQATVVLKGPGSVVATLAASEMAICQHGNPGMASAGMGDVLAGIVAGLLSHACRAQAPPDQLDEIFTQAIALHSATADQAARAVGERSLIATDVTAALPELLK